MNWFGRKQRTFKLTVKNTDLSIDVTSDETLLQAILAKGGEFPHLCRVGSCGSCKSRLTQGKVKMLVDLYYVLSVDEINQGYVLPCQAIAQSDCELSHPPLAAQKTYDDLDAVEWPDSGGIETAKTDA